MDIVTLGTKANTLAELAPLVKTCHIGDQFTFTVSQWNRHSGQIIKKIQHLFSGMALIIRSSTLCEDNIKHSNAGIFDSVSHVDSTNLDSIKQAIYTVIRSYQKSVHALSAQVLIQAQIYPVQYSGVIFTCRLDTGAPYYQINIDDKSQSTEAVTSGTGQALRTFMIERQYSRNYHDIPELLHPILRTVHELETLLQHQKLDIEFAVDKLGKMHVFQVRPITVDHSTFKCTDLEVHDSLNQAAHLFRQLQSPNPFTLGKKTYFGNMPDWNPAEIIGTRPNPLAFSLYRFLITDDAWATQRAQAGYRDIRPHALLVSFCGQPYVNIRASLNSFIPANLSEHTAEIIVDAYLEILKKNPILHDKIEFDVAITCWTPSFTQDIQERLDPFGISSNEINQLEITLKEVTKRIITTLQNNTESLNMLQEKRIAIEHCSLPPLEKALALIKDCKQYGTLAFAHAARAAFVSNALLKSFKKIGIISEDEFDAWLHSIRTVVTDFYENSAETLHARFGHLRPGTYDITVPAYWENPELYYTANTIVNTTDSLSFTLSEKTKNDIESCMAPLCLGISIDELIDYIKTSIQLREYVKFEFTRNLSRALDEIIRFGGTQGLSRSEMSFLEYSDLLSMSNGSLNKNQLISIINDRRKSYSITQMVTLPSLLFNENDFYCFERLSSEPNYITQQAIEAPCVNLSKQQACSLTGAIVLISQADPGYDWIFKHHISGLITQYGGANSHMAIRAAEMNLPAAIGVGDKLYDKLISASHLQLDCANSTIRIIK